MEYQICDLKLMFSTNLNGYSLATLYSETKNYENCRGMIFCLKTTQGAVFGGFVNRVFQVTEEYFIGSDDCFVFTLLPTRHVFKSANINPDHLRCCAHHFTMGSRGKGEAIRIGEDFGSGSTYESETYANIPLTGSADVTMFTCAEFVAYALQ